MTTDKEIQILNSQDLTNHRSNVKLELPKYWDKAYILEKIASIEKISDKMLFNFLWRSGCRISEVLNLKKKDFDFENYIFKVRWLKSRKYKERIVPMHPRLRDVMQVYTAPYKAEEKIFDITRQRAWQLSKKYFNGHPHMFRHSYAVNWLRCAGDIVVLHRILGHSKIQTTMEYLKIVPVDQGKELIKINFD